MAKIVVPARGLARARVDGLIADGKAYVVGPNALIHLEGGNHYFHGKETELGSAIVGWLGKKRT